MQHERVGERVHRRLRWLRVVTVIMLLMSRGLCPDGADAADRTRPFRIGALTSSWGPTPSTVGLRDRLVELGYREDEDFVLGIRFTQGDITALPAVARELVQYGVDVIFANDDHAAKAAQDATTQVPIVFVGVSDPVRLGLIQSFARPGGNITGVADLSANLGPKRLQVFREMIPGLQRILVPYDAADAIAVAEVQTYREAASRLGIELVAPAMRTQAEARALLAQVRKGDVDGIVSPTCCSLNLPGVILDVASQEGIPTIFEAAFWVERGALSSYGADYYETGRQAARLVDKILKGATPADLPVEVNAKIEFAINLKTAKALGLTIAPEVLFQANRVVR